MKVNPHLHINTSMIIQTADSPASQSDHPAIVSRYLIHEAAQAHYWGLQEHIALSSVITTPARVLGLDHRIGYIQQGPLAPCST